MEKTAATRGLCRARRDGEVRGVEVAGVAGVSGIAGVRAAAAQLLDQGAVWREHGARVLAVVEAREVGAHGADAVARDAGEERLFRVIE